MNNYNYLKIRNNKYSRVFLIRELEVDVQFNHQIKIHHK
jgi:hypothetical protein